LIVDEPPVAQPNVEFFRVLPNKSCGFGRHNARDNWVKSSETIENVQ
jgi:hypothetical protein